MYWDPVHLHFVGGVGFERHVDVQNPPGLDYTIGLPPRIDVRVPRGLDDSIDLLRLPTRPRSQGNEGFVHSPPPHHHQCQRY